VSRPAAGALFALAIFVTCGSPARAQVVVGGIQPVVGGVFIDPSGALTHAPVEDLAKIREAFAEQAAGVPAALQVGAKLRKISLRRLEAAIQLCKQTGKPLPNEMNFLGGLQEIRYVLVYPEQNDLVLAGPAEGWKVDAQGSVVGAKSNRPVMLLDDFLVALRTALSSSRGVISCSIDPSQEGVLRLRQFEKTLHTVGNPEMTARAFEEQLGSQRITVGGVPATSHFARVLVAADYRMKRISMGREAAPVANLPSLIAMSKATSVGMKNNMPRFWLEPDYKPLSRDAEGLTWQLRPATVKCLTENDFFDAVGVKHPTGTSDPVSQKWAATMTERYEALSKADPIFAELRNCMDLAVVAALVARENLTAKAKADLPLLLGGEGLQTATLAAPQRIASQAAAMNKGHKWMFAVGGVQINPWTVIGQAQQSASLGPAHGAARPGDDARWWWD
jgi:hypothetical protein